MRLAATATSATPMRLPKTSTPTGMKLSAEMRVAAMMGTQTMWIHLFLSHRIAYTVL
jgi:hypothetical protein